MKVRSKPSQVEAATLQDSPKDFAEINVAVLRMCIAIKIMQTCFATTRQYSHALHPVVSDILVRLVCGRV